MKKPPRGEFIPREEKVKQISLANGVKEGTVLLSAWCLSLDLRPTDVVGVNSCRRDNLKLSAIKFGAISHTSLVNLYASTNTPPLSHPLLGPHAPRTKAALWEHCGIPREQLYPRMPSRWQRCLTQVVGSVNLVQGRRKMVSGQQTPHGSSLTPDAGPEVASRGQKSKGPE